jgi:hypothetical protein
MLRSVALVRIDILEESSASITRVTRIGDMRTTLEIEVLVALVLEVLVVLVLVVLVFIRSLRRLLVTAFFPVLLFLSS